MHVKMTVSQFVIPAKPGAADLTGLNPPLGGQGVFYYAF